MAIYVSQNFCIYTVVVSVYHVENLLNINCVMISNYHLLSKYGIPLEVHMEPLDCWSIWEAEIPKTIEAFG